MGKSLFDKVWDLHTVRRLPSGETQLFIGLHLIHEVTSPQAFGMLRDLGRPVFMPERTFATLDHIVPTDGHKRPFGDALAEGMVLALEKACREHGIRYFDRASGRQGIVHVIGPELGLTQPGITIACGDSHTSTHGAFGAIAMGIGTTQVRDVLATQCLSMSRLKVRRIEITGTLGPGVYAKDVVLHLIRRLGVAAGAGYAYEYGGAAVEALSMEERMTLCNMSIEGGARVGYVNPDEVTFAYLKGRPYAPPAASWDEAVAYWKSIASDPDAHYDDVVRLDAAEIAPTVTWGINPGQAISVKERVPKPARCADRGRSIPRRRSARLHAPCGGQIPSKGRRSALPSSGAAPTAAFRTFARWRSISTESGSPRACARWPCPGRWRSRAPRHPKGSTACFATPVSSGASPAARCASP